MSSEQCASHRAQSGVHSRRIGGPPRCAFPTPPESHIRVVTRTHRSIHHEAQVTARQTGTEPHREQRQHYVLAVWPRESRSVTTLPASAVGKPCARVGDIREQCSIPHGVPVGTSACWRSSSRLSLPDYVRGSESGGINTTSAGVTPHTEITRLMTALRVAHPWVATSAPSAAVTPTDVTRQLADAAKLFSDVLARPAADDCQRSPRWVAVRCRSRLS